jgi:probable sporulation protein (polysaccharide deacetylase family)
MRKKVIFLCCVFAAVFIGLCIQPINAFIHAVKSGETREVWNNSHGLTSLVSIWGEKPDDHVLMKEIQAEAGKRKEAPVDAKVDRIWKAMPGYNGREVDVEKTYQLAKEKPPGTPITYVYKEIEPKVKLEELGAHPIYKGNPRKQMAALMINVAWGNEFLPGMLETLRKENVKATFFLDGSWLKKNVDMAKQIQAEGHEISNHGYSHKNMSELSRQKAAEEIVKTEQLIKKELGVNNTLFAPPSGDFDQETVQIAHEQGLKTIMWSLDTIDWKNPGAARINQKISQRMEPGFLVLMHPTSSSSEALPEMIKIIKNKGIFLGTVSDVLSSKRLPEPQPSS